MSSPASHLGSAEKTNGLNARQKPEINNVENGEGQSFIDFEGANDPMDPLNWSAAKSTFSLPKRINLDLTGMLSRMVRLLVYSLASKH